ncbi:hypothetical protein JHK86_055650 [Glycine max]|nr:hypothetical protein JHK86_055650 [Glycine max]
MTMGRGGDKYCLLNSRPRLSNMSPYPYPIPDGLKFIIPSPYLLGIGYPRPRPVPNSN